MSEINAKINNELNLKSNQINISLLKEMTKDSFADCKLDNTFCIFLSINNIFHLIYVNKNKSMISYDLVNDKKLNEIKISQGYISFLRHYLDKFNKRDLIMTVSVLNFEHDIIKVWNILNYECILKLGKNNSLINTYGATFFNDNIQNYIVTNNRYFDGSLFIIFDFEGNTIKKIQNFHQAVKFIDTYNDIKFNKFYIILCGCNSIISYDFKNDSIYKVYEDNSNLKNFNSKSFIINEKNEIIASCNDGNIRIWDFYTSKLLKRINICNRFLYGFCLYKNIIFVGDEEGDIALVDISNEKIINKIKGEGNSFILTIKKIIHSKYGLCLITQGFRDGQIKLWKINE